MVLLLSMLTAHTSNEQHTTGLVKAWKVKYHIFQMSNLFGKIINFYSIKKKLVVAKMQQNPVRFFKGRELMNMCRTNKQLEDGHYIHIYHGSRDGKDPPRHKQNMAPVLPSPWILLHLHFLHHNRELIGIGRLNKQPQDDYYTYIVLLCSTVYRDLSRNTQNMAFALTISWIPLCLHLLHHQNNLMQMLLLLWKL